MFYIQADMTDPAVAHLARAFETDLVVLGVGSSGMLGRVASERGITTISVEMGEAHRFERDLIDHASECVRSTFAEYDLHPQGSFTGRDGAR